MENSKQIKWGAVISYITIAFNIVAGLLYTPWMINTVGKEQYALYTIALSVINIFLMDFGVGSAVTRFLSRYYAEGKHQEANRFMGVVYKVYFVISAVVAACLFAFYFLIETVYVELTASEIQILKNLFIIVSVYSVISFPCVSFNGVLMANERFIAVKLCTLGQKVLDAALIVAALLMGQGIYTMVLIHAVSNLSFQAVRYFIIRTKTDQKTDLKIWDKKQARSLFSYSVWTTVNSIAQRCMLNIMPSLIGALIGSKEVTIFGLASALEAYIYGFANAINGMFMPRISRIMTSDSKSQLHGLMCKLGTFHVYTIGLIIVGFACLGNAFVTLWMGPGYEQVYIAAVLLMLPSLIDVPQQAAKTALLTENIIKEQAVIYLIMAVINVLLSFVLIPQFGAIGAAISVCAAYFVRTLLFNFLYHKRLPVRLGDYFKKAYLKWIIPAAAAAASAITVTAAFQTVTVLSFVASGAVMVLVYLILLWFLAVDRQMKDQVLGIFKKTVKAHNKRRENYG